MATSSNTETTVTLTVRELAVIISEVTKASANSKTFPLDYVRELRAENAHYRVRAKELEARKGK